MLKMNLFCYTIFLRLSSKYQIYQRCWLIKLSPIILSSGDNKKFIAITDDYSLLMEKNLFKQNLLRLWKLLLKTFFFYNLVSYKVEYLLKTFTKYRIFESIKIYIIFITLEFLDEIKIFTNYRVYKKSLKMFIIFYTDINQHFAYILIKFKFLV